LARKSSGNACSWPIAVQNFKKFSGIRAHPLPDPTPIGKGTPGQNVKNEDAVQKVWGTESPSGVQGQSPSGGSKGKAPRS